MRYLVLIILCISCLELINADCIIDELDIVVTINKQPKSVCSFRNENFYEGRSIRECNIDCTCSLGRLTCCSKSKTHCQRAERCQKVIFDFNTSVFTRSSVNCAEKLKTKLVPVYEHNSKDVVVKKESVTVPPPDEVKVEPPVVVKAVEAPRETMAQRTRRLNIERIMKRNMAIRRRRKLAKAQKKKAAAKSAKSTSVKRSASTSASKTSQSGMSLMDRLRHNHERRKKLNKKAVVTSAKAGKDRAATEKVEKSVSSDQSVKATVSKVKKQASRRLTIQEILRKNRARRINKRKRMLSKGTTAVKSGKTAAKSGKSAATKGTKQASTGLSLQEILRRNRERRNKKRKQILSKGTAAAVQSKKATATKEKKQASTGLSLQEILRKNRERRNKRRRTLNGGRSSLLQNAVRRNRQRRERLRRQRLAILNQQKQ